MAVLLAYGSPALGHFLPLSALLSALTARGHQVHLRTLSGGVTAGREFGFAADRVDPRIEAIESRDWTARNAFDVLAMTVDVLCRRAVLEVDDVRRAIERVQPDALIVDANCWGAISVADAGDIPWSVFCPFTPYLRSRGVPPFGPGLRPLPGILGRVRDAQVRPVVTRLFDRRMLPRVNAIRTELGAQTVGSVDELMRRAPLLLAVGGEPFEYPHPDWGDSVHLIGACTPPQAAAEVPDWLADIDRPIVLVSTSSIRQADACWVSRRSRRLPTSRFMWSPRSRPGFLTGCLFPRMRLCANSFHMTLYSNARCAPSLMAEWEPRSEHSTARARLRRAVRPRPGRGGSPRRSGAVRHPAAGEKADRTTLARKGARRDDDDRRCRAGGGWLRRYGRDCPRCEADRATSAGWPRYDVPVAVTAYATHDTSTAEKASA